jgi:hypothetical protein
MLHREMGVPKNKKISLGSLMSAEKKAKARGDVAEERRIVFARNARKWNH